MLANEVEAVRRFNRFYTGRIGVLGEGLLDSPYPLAEVRVLYELAHRRGVGAVDLAAALGIDKGYLSRILKRFRARKWLARKIARDDARRSELTLTAAGQRALAPLEAASRRQVRELFAPLGEAQRGEVLAAMAAVSRGLSRDTGHDADIALRPHRAGDIGWVVQRHGEIYAREYGWNEEFEALVAEIAAAFLRKHDPARERCWIAERDGERIGCVFLVAGSRATAKLRLLLVEPSARGSGLGRRLVDECVGFARAARYRRVMLWTQKNLDAARHLYAAAGFRKTGEEPHRSFGRDLVAETWTLTF